MILQVRINPQDCPGGFSVFFFHFRQYFLRTYEQTEPRLERTNGITSRLINRATASLHCIEKIAKLILQLLLAGRLEILVIISPVFRSLRPIQHVRVREFPTTHSQSKLSLDEKPGICSETFGQLGRTLPVGVLFLIRGISLLGPAPELGIFFLNMPGG